MALTPTPERVEKTARIFFQLGAFTATAHFAQIRQWSPRQGSITSESTTAVTNTVNVAVANTNWLASIVGAFDDDPIYARIIENVKESRREMNEQTITFE